MSHKKKPYTSDLSEVQWILIRMLLPLKRSGPGRPIEIDMKAAVNAMLYVAKTGCQWENLPRDFPPYQSVYYHYRKWCKDGTWERVNRCLNYLVRQANKRLPYPSAGIIDSQSVKTTEVGGIRGYDGGKKVKGRKRHIVVDTLGNLWQVVVHAANIHDSEGAKLVLAALPPMLQLRLQRIWADKAYAGLLSTWCWRLMQAELEVVARPKGQHGFVVLPRRWVVERTFAWLGNYRRLSKDYEECVVSSSGMIYLASIHTSLRRLAS